MHRCDSGVFLLFRHVPGFYAAAKLVGYVVLLAWLHLLVCGHLFLARPSDLFIGQWLHMHNYFRIGATAVWFLSLQASHIYLVVRYCL